MKKSEKDNYVVTNEVFVVSYDVYGYESDIQSFLFSTSQVDERKVALLRNEYEYEKQCVENVCSDVFVESLSEVEPFEEWVMKKGIWCSKVVQIRVKPKKYGQHEDYDSMNLETHKAFS